jgi:dihydropteroate synthase type 2
MAAVDDDLLEDVMMAGPGIVGVVNLTDDSFSDGGLYRDSGKALEHARRLAQDGACVVELGPASSHPDSTAVSPEEEVRRLAPVLEPLVAAGVPVSVDSFQPHTQRWALAHGATWLNDIRGFPNAEVRLELARAGATAVVMHSIQRGPATRTAVDGEGIVAAVESFLAERLAALRAAGVAVERVILDPGMGFFLGDSPEPSLRVLRALPELRARLGARLLVSVSRKSFLGALTGRGVHERGAATLAAELFAAAQGVDFIRTHDVAALRDALSVREALGGRLL